LLSVTSWLASGLQVTNNRVVHGRFARGIVCFGITNANLSGNYVHDTNYAGVLLVEQIAANDWQCGPLASVNISNNVVELANQQLGAVEATQLGAVQIFSTNSITQAVTTQPNQGITVNANFISTTPRSGLWYANCASGSIQGNVFQETSQQPSAAEPQSSPYDIWNSPTCQALFAEPQVVQNSGVTGPTVINGTNPLLYIAPSGRILGDAVPPSSLAVATQTSPPSANATQVTLVDSTGTSYTNLQIIEAAWPSVSFQIPAAAADGAGVVTIVSGTQTAMGGVFIGADS
jgi:hypothetical protein